MKSNEMNEGRVSGVVDGCDFEYVTDGSDK